MVSMFFLCDEFLPFGDKKNIFLINFLHCSKLGCKLDLCVLNCPICQLLQGLSIQGSHLIHSKMENLDMALARPISPFLWMPNASFFCAPFCTLSILKFNAISCSYASNEVEITTCKVHFFY